MRILLISFLSLLPTTARPCGGFAMSAADLSPVEQSSERVLIIVHDDGTLTAVLEHGFRGEPEDFAWILPVPGTPTLSVVPTATLRLLDRVTVPVLQGPSSMCKSANSDDGCGCTDRLASAGGAPKGGVNDDGGGVDVEELPQVGPYDPQIVHADTPAALTTWLDAHGYVVTPEMEPYIAPYVDAGLSFLVVRLAPGAGVQDIAPLALSLSAGTPVVPLGLTATAAEPQMGVAVMVIAGAAYESSNWQNLTIPAGDVRVDLVSGQHNYDALVAYRIDAAGGEAVVRETVMLEDEAREAIRDTFFEAADLAEAKVYLLSQIDSGAVVTRMFTRFSPWRVTSDPAFAPRATSEPRSRFISVPSDGLFQEICEPRSDRTPCLDTYCGQGAECAVTTAGDGCLCPEGDVARRIGDEAHRSVACAPAGFDFLGSVAGLADPCVGSICGENGTCTAQNGFPTCTCHPGYAAVLDGAGVLVCLPPIASHGPERLLTTLGEPAPDEGCAAATGDAAPWLVLLGGALWRRHRSRRAT